MKEILRGTILKNRYEVTRFLGEGATSSVYLARDKKETGNVWALKQLTHVHTEEERDALLKEARLLSQLSHENLISLIDYFIEDGYDFMVMERVTGPTLDEIIAQSEQPVAEKTALEWAIQICRVLGYLHRQDPPIVYRDLKPANVMITVRGKVKLIDLGIARHFNPKKLKDTTPLGTPGYCPPEQYGRGQTDQRSDVYALGATLYHALTLKDPNDYRFSFPPITTENPNLTEKIEEILAKCLKNDPDERWPDANVLYDHVVAHHARINKTEGFGHRIRIHYRNYSRRVSQLVTKLLNKTGKKTESLEEDKES